jgi:hypothetical protein
MGAAKVNISASRQLLLGVYAGACIAFSAALAMTCGGNMPALAASNPGLQKMLFGAFGCALGNPAWPVQAVYTVYLLKIYDN